ncbi:BrnA antitoxin family protein [Rhodoblastus acidophilus]|uniref:BrnA antitoxin family protein n=1 Tax=Candidatus Rhodoblastus alkanivorans TaxID=2954117 RepID=A0ABS9ZE60_9HYPH|nr:BrnA antitoxin family protein [Candidatus Rhodoblastus alkanivorans]MCI4680842.1 BrnA antitoxin family protein [Candidatus Rhodoblastus alkanivorans]MCI4685051.1 BrnA antitoxin family protein [Candidatus Rhodoblastus alkanivorans]MDI4643303.1 BrnA antitoxin family protein [Rhodoblastus acidophilus]
MAKKEHIVSYTAEELRAMQARGESKSDWARAAAMTDAELEASIAADPDEAGLVADWSKASVEMPQPKAVLNMRVDRDVLEFFRREGRGYQTKINAVLRSYVEQMTHHKSR